MSTDENNPASPTSSETKNRRGRPQAGPETHRQRISRLQVEIRQAQEALRVSEEKRASIVGHASLRHAGHNAEFARQLAAALRAEIRSKADRATVGDLLADNAPEPTA
jgi:hypothetical protein